MNQDPGRVPSQRGSVVASLLKAPESVADMISERRTPLATGMTLLGAAAVCHAVFGLAIGLFGGWSVAIMDAVKIPLVAVCSLLLCYPSLYVFSCVGGTPLSLSQAFLLGASCLAMLGLLLVGLAPVAWLFSVSTESLPFVAMLTLFIWLIAVSFAVRYIGKLRAHALFTRAGGIKLWFFVLVLVTVQMVTCMRPILTPPETEGWWTAKKMFFIQHFGSTFETKK